MRAIKVPSIVSLSLLGACLTESGFVDQHVARECEILFDCYDEGGLADLGWEGVDDCVASETEALADRTEGCTFDPEAAKACKRAMGELAACPQDGEAFEPPGICEAVYVDCPGLSEEQFQQQSTVLACEWLVDCYDDYYGSIDECVEDATSSPPDPSCTYDAVVAAACLEELQALTCDFDPAVDSFPACESVYVGCADGSE